MARNDIFYYSLTLALIIGISDGQNSLSSYSVPPSSPPISVSQPASPPTSCSLNCGSYGRCTFNNCPSNVSSCCACNRGYVGDNCERPASSQVDLTMKCEQLVFSDELKDKNSQKFKEAENVMCKVPLDALRSPNIKCFARSFDRGSVIGALTVQSDNPQNLNSIINRIKNFCEGDDGCKKLGVDTNSLTAANATVEVDNNTISSNTTGSNSTTTTSATTTATCTLKCIKGVCSNSCPDSATQCCACNNLFVGDYCDTPATKQVVLNFTFTDFDYDATEMGNTNSAMFKKCSNRACSIVKNGMRKSSNVNFYCWLRKLYKGSVVMESGVQGTSALNANTLVSDIKSYCNSGSDSSCSGLSLNTITAAETTVGGSGMTIFSSIWLIIITFIMMVMIY